MVLRRFFDRSGNVWLFLDHETSVPTIALAVPITSWPGRLAALQPLISELWAQHVTTILKDRGVIYAVRPIPSPDLIGITIETNTSDTGALIGILHALVDDEFLLLRSVPPSTRAAAIRQLRRSVMEIEALRLFAFGDHRYASSVEERIQAVSQAELTEAGKTLASERRIALHIAPSVPVLPGLTPAAEADRHFVTPTLAPRQSAEQRIVRYSHESSLARMVMVLPGTTLSSPSKHDLHVAWSLLRSREGAFFPKLRSRGGLVYSVAAFSREYADSGYGMVMVKCDPSSVRDVEDAYTDAIADLSQNTVKLRVIDETVESLCLDHRLAMRNPVALARNVLAHEVAGSSVEDYTAALSQVSPESVTAACATFMRSKDGLEILTLPGNSGAKS